MIFRLTNVLAWLIVVILWAEGKALLAQQKTAQSRTAPAAAVSLAELVHHLPDSTEEKRQLGYSGPLENATVAERDLCIPDSFPSAATAEYSGIGLEDLIKLVVPMLREPDVVTEYADPVFIQSDQYILSAMPPEQQAHLRAQPRKVIRLPAEGAGLLAILALPTWKPFPDVHDAMIAFLDREDQTKSTLQDCLHTLAPSDASERVNDEALRRVFEQEAMTIFLLQFIAEMRLSPAHLKIKGALVGTVQRCVGASGIAARSERCGRVLERTAHRRVQA